MYVLVCGASADRQVSHPGHVCAHRSQDRPCDPDLDALALMQGVAGYRVQNCY